MTESRVGRLAWVLPVLSLALGTTYVAFTLAAPSERRDPVPVAVLLAVLFVSWAAVGAVIITRRPRHPVGWLLGVGGVAGAVAFVGLSYTWVEPALPARDWVWWATSWADAVFDAAIALVLLVFPDGRLASRRWRPAVWVTAAGVILVVVGRAVSPPLHMEWVQNPTGLTVSEGHPLYDGVAGWLLLFVGLLAAVASFVVRFRRSGPEQRRQLQWLVLAAVVAALGVLATAFSLLLGGNSGVAELLAIVALLGFPVAIGVGILRYRLFDIDLLLRRSLVYGLLWLAVGGVYLALAALPGMVVGEQLPVQAAIALTVLATLAFQPARRAVDRLVGRLLFGERPSGFELLSHFGATVADTFDVAELAPRVADTIRQGLDLRWVRVQLEVGEPAGALTRPGGAVGIGLDDPSRPAATIPLVHGHQRVGAIECGPKREGRFSERDHQLLASLARQAALGIHNARLAAELSARLDEIRRQATELAASRARLVAAQDTERQRLERDLHDGVQQQVVSLLVRLGLARTQLRRDPLVVETTLAELQAQTGQVLRDLRALVQGIHPPVLADRGLLEALEARLAHVPIGVQIHADPALRDDRFPPEVEAAAYFFVSEGLTNAMKHADASRVAIHLTVADERLTVEVHDDGIGFVPTHARESGLSGLRDRIEAVGGHLQVTSRPGAGCRLTATVPATPRRPEIQQVR
jgi:signal transduction histidine kinase